MKGGITMTDHPIDPTRPCLRRNGLAQRKRPVSWERIWAWQFMLAMATFIALTVLDLRAIFAGTGSTAVHVLNWVGLVLNWIGIVTAICFRTVVKWQKIIDGGK